MTPLSHKPIPTPLGQRLQRGSRRYGPVFVWLAAIGLASWLLTRDTGTLEVVAIAQPVKRQVAALVPGKLAAIAVEPFSAVEQGQVVGMLDDASLEVMIRTAQAEAEQIRSEIEAARIRLRNEASASQGARMDDLRQFETDVERYRSQALELKTSLSEDRVELERLGLELQRMQRLADQDIISDSELDNSQLRYNALEGKIAESENLLRETEASQILAEKRREEYQRDYESILPQDAELEPLRLALIVQERKIEELTLEQQGMLLRAPVAGSVSALLRGVGEVVRPGDAIMEITTETSDVLVAYLDQTQASRVSPSAKATLSLNTEPRHTVVTQVLRVGPALEQMPERLWRMPNSPQYGRPALLATQPGLNLLPGEIVQVRLTP